MTLEVTPSQAENLDLARSVGTLSLVLRNQVDPKLGETEGATKASLLKEDHPAPPVVAAPAPASAPAPVVARRPRPAKVVTVAAAPPPVIAAPAPPAPPRHCVEVIRGTLKTNECF